MNVILFCKLLTEISLYFTFAQFVGAIAGVSGSLLRSALLLTLTGTVGRAIDRSGRPWLRWLALALLIPTFYLTKSWLDVLLLLIPTAYVIAMLLRHLGDASYYEYQHQYITGVKLQCVAGVLLLMSWQHPVVADRVLPYVFCYLVGGVLALRLLRHCDDMIGSRRLWLNNMVSVLALCAAGLLLTSEAAGRLALGALKLFFEGIIYPILSLFTWLMSLVMYALWSVVSKIDFGENGEGMEALTNFARENSEMLQQQGEINTVPTDVLIGALLVAIFAALAFMMVRFLKKSTEQRQNAIHEVRSRIDGVVSNPKVGLLDRGPRARVRAIYRKFISLCIGAGARIQRTDTTEDIERIAQAVLLSPPRTKDLQQIYRKARYSAAEITEADVSEAKAAYQAAKSYYKKLGA